MSEETEDELLAPPWIAYPGYTRYTIGWRMGSGEDYIWKWWEMVRAMPRDFETRCAYLMRFDPAPRPWADTVAEVLGISDDTSFGVRREVMENLLNLGLVGDDIAYKTWREKHITEITSWLRRTSPESAARYSTRDFSFLCRHIDETRGTPEHEARVDELIPDNSDWSPYRTLLARARDDHDFDLPAFDLGSARLAAELSAFGEPTPPWEYDLDPRDRERDHGGEGYVYLWSIWENSVIDDPPSWQAYLSRHSEQPAEWREPDGYDDDDG